jgi:hypothetical protein
LASERLGDHQTFVAKSTFAVRPLPRPIDLTGAETLEPPAARAANVDNVGKGHQSTDIAFGPPLNLVPSAIMLTPPATGCSIAPTTAARIDFHGKIAFCHVDRRSRPSSRRS